jgi:hypothetical protein
MKKGKVAISPKTVRYICLLLIVLSIGGCIYLGVLYNGDQGDKDDVEEQIALKTPQMKILEDAREGKNLGELLEETAADLKTMKARIPGELDSTDVTEMLMELAEQAEVDIFPVAGRVGKASATTIAGNAYYIVAFNLTPRGSYDQVVDFIALLESGEMENISLSYTTITDSGGSWSAQLNGIFYSRVAEVAESQEASE